MSGTGASLNRIRRVICAHREPLAAKIIHVHVALINRRRQSYSPEIHSIVDKHTEIEVEVEVEVEVQVEVQGTARPGNNDPNCVAQSKRATPPSHARSNAVAPTCRITASRGAPQSSRRKGGTALWPGNGGTPRNQCRPRTSMNVATTLSASS